MFRSCDMNHIESQIYAKAVLALRESSFACTNLKLQVPCAQIENNITHLLSSVELTHCLNYFRTTRFTFFFTNGFIYISKINMKIFVQLENRYCVKSMSLFNESRNGKRFTYDIGGRNAKVININDALCIFLVIRTKRQVITEWPVIKLEYRCIVYFMLLLWTVCMHMLRYVYVFSVFLVVSTYFLFLYNVYNDIGTERAIPFKLLETGHHFLFN